MIVETEPWIHPSADPKLRDLLSSSNKIYFKLLLPKFKPPAANFTDIVCFWSQKLHF